jgi:hypothetical protein
LAARGLKVHPATVARFLGRERMKRLLVLLALSLASAPAIDCWAEGAAEELVGTDGRGKASSAVNGEIY